MTNEMFQYCQHFVLIIMCSVVTFAHAQVSSELDKPYLTKEGVFYRDVLTVASAKGVAQFAKSYQRQQRGLVKQNNSNHRATLLLLYVHNLCE